MHLKMGQCLAWASLPALENSCTRQFTELGLISTLTDLIPVYVLLSRIKS